MKLNPFRPVSSRRRHAGARVFDALCLIALGWVIDGLPHYSSAGDTLCASGYALLLLSAMLWNAWDGDAEAAAGQAAMEHAERRASRNPAPVCHHGNFLQTCERCEITRLHLARGAK